MTENPRSFAHSRLLGTFIAGSSAKQIVNFSLGIPFTAFPGIMTINE